MAIGTAAAIGLGVAGVGSVLGAKSANKASKRAAQVSQENNAQNVALQREVYGQNKALLSPFVQRGNAAGDTINALLGLGGSQQTTQQTTQQQPNALSQFYGGPIDYGGLPNDGYNNPLARDSFPFTSSTSRNLPSTYPGAIGGYGGGTFNTNGTQATPAQGGVTAQQAANDAFDIYRNSTGYQFRLGEGMNALNSGYAGAGILQSGDALRAATEYGQNFASNEFGNYLGYLGNQQGVGLSAGSAVAGVGQNYANNVTAQNTQNAANQANAILSRQNGFANALGAIGGGLFSYGTGRL